jgi:AcrR family transcriptional regulator
MSLDLAKRVIPAPSPGSGNKREALIKAARKSFGRIGYHATATNDLVAAVSATRGVLYHHFADKKALFEVVAREIAEELSRDASNKVLAAPGSTWHRLTTGFRTYLGMVASSTETQRILLIDGPSVLGWAGWRSLQSEIVFPGIVYTLNLLMDEGIMPRRAPEPLAHLTLAALNDAALAIAHAEDSASVHEEMCDALMVILEGLTR